MNLDAQKEQFSRAYVQAFAAVAGFTWSQPSVDDDSVDMTISARGGCGTIRSPKLDLQLKCHSQDAISRTDFSFPLKIKNYDDLRDESVMVPRILILVIVPHRVADWISHSESELALRRCGYWVSLRGLPASPNTTTVSVTFHRYQQFHSDGVVQLMQRIGAGELP